MTIRVGETPDPIEIRVAPYVVIEGGWVNSNGKPRSGGDLWIIGNIDGQSWHTTVHPSDKGRFSVQVPHGLERAQITLFPGQLTSTRYRIGKAGGLKAGQYIMFGQHDLERDVKDLQIFRYEKTGMIIRATTEDGRSIRDVILAGKYTEEIADAGTAISLRNGVSSEILFESQNDGRFRTDKLTPDREVEITAYADGFKPSSRKFKLPEGKIEEATFVLEPK